MYTLHLPTKEEVHEKDLPVYHCYYHFSFSDILDNSGQRHILVHCQVNRRASLFTFLYRAAHENAAADQAYENVTSIWSPEPHWLEFANNVMSRHQIEFDPL